MSIAVTVATIGFPRMSTAEDTCIDLFGNEYSMSVGETLIPVVGMPNR